MPGGEDHGRVAMVCRCCRQRCAARDFIACGQRGIALLGFEAGDANRWHRREVMRLDSRQQVLGELRILVGKLQLDAGAEERDAFQQAFDIRVGVGRGLEAKARSNGLVLFAEFARALAQIGQLFVVKTQQTGIHRAIPALSRQRYQAPHRSGI